VIKSKILRELERNQDLRGWRPRQAQELCEERCREWANPTQFI